MQRTTNKNRKNSFSARLRLQGSSSAPTLRQSIKRNRPKSQWSMRLSWWFCRILTSSSSEQRWAARLKKEKAGSNTNQRHNPGTATSLGCRESSKGLRDFYSGFFQGREVIVGIQLTVRRHSNGGRGLLSAPAGFKNIFCLHIQGSWECPDSRSSFSPSGEQRKSDFSHHFWRPPLAMSGSCGCIQGSQTWSFEIWLEKLFCECQKVLQFFRAWPSRLHTHYTLNHSASRLCVGPSLCRALPLSAFSFTSCHHTSVTAPHRSHFLVQLLWEIRYFVFIL